MDDDLYFMRVREFVKIGRSRDPHHRRAILQHACPFEIEEPIILVGRGAEEAAWHSRFSERRVRGEWFEYCQEIADAVEFALHAPPLAQLIQMQEAGEL